MKTAVNIGSLQLKNPILTASGTFGNGHEFQDFMDLNSIGGFCSKGLSMEPRGGNPEPRIVETPSGMLNSIGLENGGAKAFLKEVLPKVSHHDMAVIVNIYAHSLDEFVGLVRYLEQSDRIDAYEMNLSCPNVAEGGAAFGSDAAVVAKLTQAARNETKKPLIIKLSPNVTDVKEMAKAAQGAGADAVSLINTLIGTAIDREKRQFILARKVGGLSGPAIKPVALKMVWETVQAVDIPVIGIGGIVSFEDVLDFLIVGATAVQIGSGNFVNPALAQECAHSLETYLEERNETIDQLIGSIHS